jgi:hypothetical protein
MFSTHIWGIMRMMNSRAITRFNKDRVKRAKPNTAIQNPYSSGFLMVLYRDFLTIGTFSSKKFNPKDLLTPSKQNPQIAMTSPEINTISPAYFKIILL